MGLDHSCCPLLSAFFLLAQLLLGVGESTGENHGSKVAATRRMDAMRSSEKGKGGRMEDPETEKQSRRVGTVWTENFPEGKRVGRNLKFYRPDCDDDELDWQID